MTWHTQDNFNYTFDFCFLTKKSDLSLTNRDHYDTLMAKLGTSVTYDFTFSSWHFLSPIVQLPWVTIVVYVSLLARQEKHEGSVRHVRVWDEKVQF